MKKLINLVLALGMALPFVAAQGFRSGFGSGFYSNSIIDLLVNNPYIRLALIFAFFYIVLFSAISRTFKGNTRMSVGLSLIISIFITITIAQRDIFYTFVGETLGTWTLFLAFAVGVIFLIKLSSDNLGTFGTITALWIFWIIGWLYDIAPIVPYSEAGDIILAIYYFITGIGGFLLLIVISLIIFFMGKKKKKDKGKITINP